jgi:hypothetical protein
MRSIAKQHLRHISPQIVQLQAQQALVKALQSCCLYLPQTLHLL